MWTVKKNVNLRRTPHFIMAALAIRDLLVTLSVVPFVIDSQVRQVFEPGTFLVPPSLPPFPPTLKKKGNADYDYLKN